MRFHGGTIRAGRKERLINEEDPASRDVKFAYTGMALMIAALVLVSILS